MKTSFRIPDDLYSWLQTQAEATGKTVTDTLITILKKQSAEGSPLIEPSTGSTYQFLDQACDLLQYLNKGFHCFIAPPHKVKLLGDGSPEDAKRFCQKCRQINIKEEDVQKYMKQEEERLKPYEEYREKEARERAEYLALYRAINSGTVSISKDRQPRRNWDTGNP